MCPSYFEVFLRPCKPNRTVTSINAPRALTFEASKVKMNLSSGWRPWPQSFLLQRYVHSSKEVPCPGLCSLLTYTSQFLPPLNQFLAPHVSVPTLLFNMVYKKISCMCDLVCLLLLEQSFSLIL